LLFENALTLPRQILPPLFCLTVTFDTSLLILLPATLPVLVTIPVSTIAVLLLLLLPISQTFLVAPPVIVSLLVLFLPALLLESLLVVATLLVISTL
jgi:hypothetical protein